MQPENQLPRDAWLNRIRYRSWHRGCKETDLILGGFCDAHLQEMGEEELTLFEQFLDEDDAEIWGWITEKSALANPAYAPLLARLQAFEVHRHLA
jgi:antitoxin CptB